mgnify:FL=1
MKTYKFKKSSLALAVSVVLSANTVIAEEVEASKAIDSKSPGLEIIEVTARKSLESLQSVPVSVTSVSAEQISENGISVMTEIQQFS